VTPLVALATVSSASLWAGQTTDATTLAYRYGLVSPQRSGAGGVTWCPTTLGLRCLQTAGGLVRTLEMAQRLGPAMDPRDTIRCPMGEVVWSACSTDTIAEQAGSIVEQVTRWLAQGLDKVRAMHKAVAEGYSVHIGCGGECDDMGKDGWWCHGCDSHIYSDEVADPSDPPPSQDPGSESMPDPDGVAPSRNSGHFDWTTREGVAAANLADEPPHSGPLSHDRDTNLDHEEI
jgi:hypothetical protein